VIEPARPAPRRSRARALLASACLGLMASASCTRTRPPTPRDVLVVSKEQEASWIRNFNPLSPAVSPRWPTAAGVYEPLLVHDSIHGVYVPWLATAHEWRDAGLTLRFTIRSGVSWSDGRPFRARDVAFTFELLRRFPALDRRGVWQFLREVRAPDDATFELAFSRPFLPGLDEIAPQPIVPEHVWRDVADPVTFANETPVATGPFTEVRQFTEQVFELGRNPHYWQPGKPAVAALRMPAYSSNDRANLGLVFDEVDWAANFVPAIDRVFVARDPAHHAYWFPLTGSTIFLYANTQHAPFDDVRVRKALSLAIDRKLLIDVALHGYSRPSDATALCDAHAGWRSLDPATAAEGDWVQFDRARAEALFDEAGLRLGADGFRHDQHGAVLRRELLVVAGWSDWVRAAQVIARNLRSVGVDASVRAYDFGAWFSRVQSGDFDLTIGWSVEGPTPYVFYRWLMSTATVKPLGTATSSNWHRFGDRDADRILEAFEREADPVAQHRLIADLTRRFVRTAPAIPLYPNPSWAEFNTQRITGFPDRDHPYADPSPNKDDRGETLLVLTALTPRPE
jgi:peptide/nickel transport system substrate-binding protein